MVKQYSLLLILPLVALLSACSTKQKVDTSSIEIDLKSYRFDQIIFDSLETAKFEQEHPAFFQLFIENVMSFGQINDPEKNYQTSLSYYRKETWVSELQQHVNQSFPNTEALNLSLLEPFKYYKHFFPHLSTPSIYYYTSQYRYGVFTGVDMICVGLDMFLGADHSAYDQIGLPKYVTRTLNEDHLLPYVMKAQIQSDFQTNALNTLLDNMIYNGKVFYCMERLLPETHDTAIIAYDLKEYEWAVDNESGIYQYLLDQELLYNSQNSKFFPFIKEGPTTTGMPQESPGNIGSWIGWQMVRTFMKEYPEITLRELMENPKLDAQYILTKSRYKPR